MRTWLYTKLESVNAPGGAHENTALNPSSIPQDKPFIVYSIGTNSPEVQDGNESLAFSEFVTIWVHGIPGDYLPIDSLLGEIRVLLEASEDDPTIISARYISTSDDLRDPEMGTIMRYSRYQIIHTAQEA